VYANVCDVAEGECTKLAPILTAQNQITSVCYKIRKAVPSYRKEKVPIRRRLSVGRFVLTCWEARWCPEPRAVRAGLGPEHGTAVFQAWAWPFLPTEGWEGTAGAGWTRTRTKLRSPSRGNLFDLFSPLENR